MLKPFAPSGATWSRPAQPRAPRVAGDGPGSHLLGSERRDDANGDLASWHGKRCVFDWGRPYGL